MDVTTCIHIAKSKIERERVYNSHMTIDHMAQWVEQLTCIQEVVGSNPVGQYIYF